MIEYAVLAFDNGDRYWFINNKLHREDGPAVEFSDGTKRWYLSGKCHRENGSAVEFYNGTKYWYLNGKFHREDGPAIEDANGDKYWYLNGEELSEEEFNKRMGKHVVQIDGKEIILSSESYESLRKSLQ